MSPTASRDLWEMKTSINYELVAIKAPSNFSELVTYLKTHLYYTFEQGVECEAHSAHFLVHATTKCPPFIFSFLFKNIFQIYDQIRLYLKILENHSYGKIDIL